MLGFRKKAINQKSVYELQTRLDTLIRKRSELDVAISEVLGNLKDNELLAMINVRDHGTGITPYQYQ
jgi:hypothetical protein